MNWPTIILATAVAAAWIAIIVTAVRNRKKGKAACACGASCAGCPMHGKCHNR